MSLVTNVVRRGGSYYFRARIPNRLESVISRKALWRSLRTLDPVIARRRGAILAALTSELWVALEHRMDKDDPHAVVRDWLNAEIADYETLQRDIKNGFGRLREAASTPAESTRSEAQPQEVHPHPNISLKATVPFSVAAKPFLVEIGRSLEPKRRRDYEKAVERFQAWMGNDPDLSAITPEMAGAFKTALTYYPARGSVRPGYRDLDFNGRVALSKEKGEAAVLDPVTINNKTLLPLRKLFAYHRQSGLGTMLLNNPFEGIAAQTGRKGSRKTRRDFTNAELKSFFREPLFTGSKGTSQAALYMPGDIRVSDWRYWVPLISIFTGARLNEVCGLALKDFRQSDGIDYLHIRDTVVGQSIKTDAAWRRVPLHEALVGLRLMDFVEQRRREGGERLFDDLEQDASGYFSDKPSKFLNRIVARITDPDPERPGKLVFYSTRHTVIGRLRSAGVRKDTSMQLVGHEDADTHSGYGDIDLSALRDAVNQVVYEGLDLTAVALPEATLPKSKS